MTYAVEKQDKHIPGLLLRTQTKTGRATWYVILARGRRVRLGDRRLMGVDEARALAKSYIVSGGPPKPAVVPAKPASFLSWILDRYKPLFLAEGGSKTNLTNFSPVVLGKLADVPLASITPAALAGWKAHRVEQGVSPATIKRNYNALHGALARAVRWGDLPAHPLAGEKPPRVAREERVRFLTADERERLEKALAWYESDPLRRNPVAAPLVRLALETGMRRGELTNLRWQDVNLADRVLYVAGATAKGRRSRFIPLNERAIAALKAVEGLSDSYVFAVKRKGSLERLTDPGKAFDAILERAGITGFRLHDCRHDVASRLVQKGESLLVVKQILGHSTMELTMRYAHLQPDAARRALEGL